MTSQSVMAASRLEVVPAVLSGLERSSLGARDRLGRSLVFVTSRPAWCNPVDASVLLTASTALEPTGTPTACSPVQRPSSVASGSWAAVQGAHVVRGLHRCLLPRRGRRSWSWPRVAGPPLVLLRARSSAAVAIELNCRQHQPADHRGRRHRAPLPAVAAWAFVAPDQGHARGRVALVRRPAGMAEASPSRSARRSPSRSCRRRPSGAGACGASTSRRLAASNRDAQHASCIGWRSPVMAAIVVDLGRAPRSPRWTMMVAVFLAMPRWYFLVVPSILVGLFPLVRLRATAAVARRWLGDRQAQPAAATSDGRTVAGALVVDRLAIALTISSMQKRSWTRSWPARPSMSA